MCISRKNLAQYILVLGFLMVCGSCATMGQYGIECQGVVQFGCPSRQEVERRGEALVVTNWEMDETTGEMVQTTYLTEL